MWHHIFLQLSVCKWDLLAMLAISRFFARFISALSFVQRSEPLYCTVLCPNGSYNLMKAKNNCVEKQAHRCAHLFKIWANIWTWWHEKGSWSSSIRNPKNMDAYLFLYLVINVLAYFYNDCLLRKRNVFSCWKPGFFPELNEMLLDHCRFVTRH